jgi:hypothetical protein
LVPRDSMDFRNLTQTSPEALLWPYAKKVLKSPGNCADK